MSGATRTALLILTDSRFPTGGHAHSGGVEVLTTSGHVHDAASLREFCRGRLHTTGLVAAGLAAAAAAGLDPLSLDEAADARTPSPALRATARKLGRQMMRTARVVWPSPALETLAAARPRGAHHAVVLGLAAASAGLTPVDAAHAAGYDSISGPASAAVRLLSLDPVDAATVLAQLAPAVDAIAERAANAAEQARTDGTDALPAASAPLLDVAAEHHATWSVRLFAS